MKKLTIAFLLLILCHPSFVASQNQDDYRARIISQDRTIRVSHETDRERAITSVEALRQTAGHIPGSNNAQQPWRRQFSPVHHPSNQHSIQNFSDSPQEAWVRHYASGLASSIESAVAAVVDNTGNVIITGSGSSQGSYYDYVTIKYDSAGNELWVARYDGPGHSYDFAQAIVGDSSGNIYVTGYSWGSGTFYDYATIKYDAFGNEIWVARYDGLGNFYDYAYDITVDASGSVYITGSSWGSGTSYDYTTVKYDASGNPLWVSRYNGPADADDGATAIAIDDSANVYATGWSTGSGTMYDYATIKYDALGNQLWASRYNGSGNENDVSNAIAVDPAGNICVTGVSVGSGSFDDFATVKYDALGNQLWAARYNGPGNGGDGGTALAIDDSGYVYVTGYIWGDPILLSFDDYATIKYSASGNQLWVAIYNGPDNFIDRATAIDVDAAGNVYVTGVSWGNTAADYATVKYNSAGSELWAVRYNGPVSGDDLAYALAVDDAGNVYVTGFAYGLGFETRDDCLTLKYDPSGNQLWFAWYDGPGNSWDQPTAMTVDGEGNVYATGTSNVGEAGNTDFVTIKYDASGIELWAVRYLCPGNAWGVPTAITVDGAGNVYVTGYVWFSDIVYIDYVTIKYDAFGNELWVAQYNGPGSANDYARGIVVDGSGNVYVTGESVGSGTTYDYATIKYDSSGNQVWVARYNGPPGNAADYANAIAVDDSGNAYVTGESRSAPTGTTYDYATIKYDASGNEIWIARYNGPGNHNDRARAIQIDDWGNVIITGSSRGSGTLEDYATIKYDASGNELWVARYNGPGNSYDNASYLAVDHRGNAYVAGSSVGSGTSYDYTTIKYDSAGNQLWEGRYNMGPGASADYAAGLVVDGSGNVYVTGDAFDGTTFDFFATIKYDSLGNQLWMALHNGHGNTYDYAEAIAVDGLGNVYITGSSSLEFTSAITTIKYAQIPSMPPVAPVLDSPPNGSINQPTSLTLIWEESIGAESYRVQLATDSNFTTLVVDDSSAMTTSYQVGPLENNTLHYWRVNAKNMFGTSDWSSVWSFTTIISLPMQVQLISPADGATVGDTVDFLWHRSQPEVDRYWFEMALDSNFTSPQVDSSLIDTTTQLQFTTNEQYWWRVKAHNAAGWGEFSEPRSFTVIIVGIGDLSQIPTGFALSQNYPNPFNPSTTIRYQVPHNSEVRIEVYNLLGQKVRTLLYDRKEPGYYQAVWDGRNDSGAQVGSGVYIYRMTAGDYTKVRKMILMK